MILPLHYHCCCRYHPFANRHNKIAIQDNKQNSGWNNLHTESNFGKSPKYRPDLAVSGSELDNIAICRVHCSKTKLSRSTATVISKMMSKVAGLSLICESPVALFSMCTLTVLITLWVTRVASQENQACSTVTGVTG